jgi:hypothetical protein
VQGQMSQTTVVVSGQTPTRGGGEVMVQGAPPGYQPAPSRPYYAPAMPRPYYPSQRGYNW